MKLPFPLILSCILGLIVCLLFQISQDVQSAEDRLDKIQYQVIQEQEKIRVYTAEWAYLTRPERLEKLAERYSELRTIDASNTIGISRIPFPNAVVAKDDNDKPIKTVAFSTQSLDIKPRKIKEIIKKHKRLASRKRPSPEPITIAFKDIWGGR